ncbi:MAG: hypothetical protein IIB73_10410 [Proteobacteria bacterium]|nr:hypothetical protein [Pseudomonadota bacterium]
MAEQTTAKRGVKTRLLGLIMIFLSILDSMLLWRAGMQSNDFYLLLFVVGGFLYAVGTIRGQ